MLNSTNKSAYKMILKNILYVISGTVILAFGTAVFIIPFNIVAGGVTGISIIIHKLLPALRVEVYVAFLTWVLFFFGLVILGKSFALKTLLSTIIYPFALSAFSKLLAPDVMNGFFNLSLGSYSEIAIILSSLFGGVFVGTGCAITFLGGGSTGGADIIALSICKYLKKAKSSVVIFLIDSLAIISGMFVLKNFVISLLGIASAFISATVIDKVFLGESKAFVAQIITDNYENINTAVIEKLKRTTTILNVTGGFSKKEKKMIMVSFSMSEYALLTGIIKTYAPDAFISIHRAHEINGNGWTR